jgi:hypothetical protein
MSGAAKTRPRLLSINLARSGSFYGNNRESRGVCCWCTELHGVATLQARVLPRWCGVAFIVALPVTLVLSNPLSFASVFVVFGLIWLALSYPLWSRRVVSAQQPSRVR